MAVVVNVVSSVGTFVDMPDAALFDRVSRVVAECLPVTIVVRIIPGLNKSESDSMILESVIWLERKAPVRIGDDHQEGQQHLSCFICLECAVTARDLKMIQSAIRIACLLISLTFDFIDL